MVLSIFSCKKEIKEKRKKFDAFSIDIITISLQSIVFFHIGKCCFCNLSKINSKTPHIVGIQFSL